MLRALALLALLPLIAACDIQRSAARICTTFPGAPALVAKSTQGAEDGTDASARMLARTEVEIEDAIRAEVARTPRRQTVTFQVVSLSAGGQYGAFGAGFLTGWSQNRVTPRPTFNLVTGVSAGATLAPVAFAGPEFDPLLEFYRGLGRDAVVRIRPVLSWPSAPSIGVPGPLTAFLDGALDRRLLDAIAQGHAENRSLLVAATNLDTGSGEVFDLGEAATAPNAATCLREAVLASSAIPGLFPPRNINNALFADGGLRAHVFLQALDRARRDVERDQNVDIKVEAYLVINGALRGPDVPVEDSLLDYVVRSVDTLADEVLRDSIQEAVTFARSRPDWRLRGIRAELPTGTCAPDADEGGKASPVGSFDPCLTTALFDHGRAVGSATPINWLSEAELLSLAQEL